MLQELTTEEMDQVSGGYNVYAAIGNAMELAAAVGVAAAFAPEAAAALGVAAGAEVLGASVNLGLVGAVLTGGIRTANTHNINLPSVSIKTLHTEATAATIKYGRTLL